MIHQLFRAGNAMLHLFQQKPDTIWRQNPALQNQPRFKRRMLRIPLLTAFSFELQGNVGLPPRKTRIPHLISLRFTPVNLVAQIEISAIGCCSFLKRSVLELLAQYDAAVLNPCVQDIIRLDAGRGEKLAGKPDSLAVSPGLKLNLHFIPSSLLDVYT